MVDRELIIIGSGIAGLSAAIYAGRANNNPLVIKGDEPGGQLTLTSEVENYPGFEEGISGPELVNRMENQAERFGTDFEHGLVEDIHIGEDPRFEIELSTDTITTNAVIIASGSSARTLDIPGEDELMGYGVSTCATCDGAFFRGEDMAVIGGGDAAFEEAHFLTKFADTVYLIHRRENFRTEEYWQERVQKKVENGEIELLKNTEATEIVGTKEEGVDHLEVVRHSEGYPKSKFEDGEDVEEFTLSVGAAFIAIGHVPNTDYLEDTPVEMGESGYVIPQKGLGGGQTKTNVEGLFVAGDVADFHYQQAVTAAGTGSRAAIDADNYLSEG